MSFYLQFCNQNIILCWNQLLNKQIKRSITRLLQYRFSLNRPSSLMSQINHRSPEQLFQLFQEAKSIHNKNKTSSRQFQSTLQFIQNNIQQSFSFLSCSLCGGKSKSNVDQAFKRGFKTLNLQQKIIYFWKLCSFSEKLQKNLEIQQNKDQKDTRQMLDTTIYIKIEDQYPKWAVTQIIISKLTKKMTIVERARSINLNNYIIRTSSNKQKQSFALQSISKQEYYKTIRISNEGHSFAVTKRYFCEVLDSAYVENINQILKLKAIKQINQVQNNQNSQKVQLKMPSLLDKMMTFKLLSPQYSKKDKKTIQKQLIQKQKMLRNPDSSYQMIDKALVPQNIITNLKDLKNFATIKKDQNLGVYYHKTENKVRKVYEFKCNQIVIFDWLVDQLNNFSTFHKWKQNMHQITCLKMFPSQRTKLFYQIFKHPQKMNYIFIRHYFQRRNQLKQKQSRNDKIHYFFDKSINKELAKEYFKISEPIAQVNYIIWKFQEVNDSVIVTVQGECDYYLSRQKNLAMMDDYLGSFQNIQSRMQGDQDEQSDVLINTFLFQNQYIEQINQIQNQGGDTEYFSISQSNQQQNNAKAARKPILKNAQIFSSKKSLSLSDILVQTTNNLLKFKHIYKPFKKSTPLLRKPLYGDHIQWEKQWVINSKGDLICVDKKKIDAQNSVLKSVFKKIGRNLFSGKSILSMSLPVQVFGDDSNLSRLCNSFGYAPVFLQKAQQAKQPIQTFINVIAFSITTSVLYLRMDKPFNPILGQTYQGLVDGCPIYGEQICHHPPISAVFLKGRGYTLYGNFQAKVEMSLNSAAGSNDGAMYISFDHHDITKKIIKYTAPAGQLCGLMYGDRKFQFIKKSVFFDEQNLFFCQLNWSKHKGKTQNCKFFDGVEGQVVRLKKSFNKNNWKNVKKQNIQQQLDLINGRWTSAVYYGKDLLFDTYKVLPYKLEYYPSILQSDSSKRKDINLRRIAVGDDMNQVQEAKQELQQIQRNDRKLRAKYSGKQH